MRAVVQRVSQASVTIAGECVGAIDHGLMVLVGVQEADTEKDMDYIIKKILGLRIFSDEAGKMNLSVTDIKGKLLIVSNFTLYGDVRKGNRPSFMAAGSPVLAEEKYQLFLEKLAATDILFETGRFGADMQVALVNDGPVTLMLDSDKLF